MCTILTFIISNLVFNKYFLKNLERTLSRFFVLPFPSSSFRRKLDSTLTSIAEFVSPHLNSIMVFYRIYLSLALALLLTYLEQ